VKGEAARLYTDAPEPYDGVVASALDLERQVTDTPELEGVVLRYGHLYGPGTVYSATSETAEQVRKRRFPIVGSGEGIFSFVHVTDAAEAAVCAVEGGDPGIYNVVDDNPAAVHEWLPAYAQALGAPPPRRVPSWLARLVAGPTVIFVMTEQRGAANAKFRAKLRWTPRYLNWRDGFKQALG
jgi:nucleoside-diphosphate-sugar epimerase